VVSTANVVLAIMAYRSWSGLVVENSYVASQRFNEDTAAQLKSNSLGITHKLHFADGRLNLSLSMPDGKILEMSKLRLYIGKPSDGRHDRMLALSRVGDGNYAVTTELDPGVWSGEIIALINGSEEWKQPIRLIVGGR
jgi:nitrogen fixation protein FixH